MEDTEKQGGKQAFNPTNNILPYMWKKGQSGNPKGRPKGQTMKEWLREYFQTLTDEERLEYLEGIDKIDLLKMAEGNPETKSSSVITIYPEPIAPLKQNEIQTNNSLQEDSQPREENKDNPGGDISLQDSISLNLLNSEGADGQDTHVNFSS